MSEQRKQECFDSIPSVRLYTSHAMRKPVYAICERQRRRSACSSAQPDQRLCCLQSRWYNSSSFYIQNCKPLASFCGCTVRFESYLVENPEDRFSRDEAHIKCQEINMTLWSNVNPIIFDIPCGLLGKIKFSKMKCVKYILTFKRFNLLFDLWNLKLVSSFLSQTKTLSYPVVARSCTRL